VNPKDVLFRLSRNLTTGWQYFWNMKLFRREELMEMRLVQVPKIGNPIVAHTFKLHHMEDLMYRVPRDLLKAAMDETCKPDSQAFVEIVHVNPFVQWWATKKSVHYRSRIEDVLKFSWPLRDNFLGALEKKGEIFRHMNTKKTTFESVWKTVRRLVK
jgi:hypothetical protein